MRFGAYMQLFTNMATSSIIMEHRHCRAALVVQHLLTSSCSTLINIIMITDSHSHTHFLLYIQNVQIHRILLPLHLLNDLSLPKYPPNRLPKPLSRHAYPTAIPIADPPHVDRISGHELLFLLFSWCIVAGAMLLRCDFCSRNFATPFRGLLFEEAIDRVHLFRDEISYGERRGVNGDRGIMGIMGKPRLWDMTLDRKRRSLESLQDPGEGVVGGRNKNCSGLPFPPRFAFHSNSYAVSPFLHDA